MWIGCAWLVSIAGACGGSSSDGEESTSYESSPSATTRDSAGVEIVTVNRTQWPRPDPWVVEAEPLLDMGDLDGDESQQFFRVRGLARFSDGRVLVANSGSSQVRAYSSAGDLLWSAGGEGEGPGEFRALFGARIRKDTVYAHDFMLARVTVFDDEGTFVRTITLDRTEGRPHELWVGDDGFMALLLVFPEQIGEEPTFRRREARYLRFRSDGSLDGLVAKLRGQEMIATAQSMPGGGVVMTSTTPLISNQQQQAVVGGRLVAAETDRFSVNAYSAAGVLERIIRYPSRERPVGLDEWERALDERLEAVETPTARKHVEEQAALKPAPEIRPNYGRFLADSEGYVWIAPFRPERDQPIPYTVLDPHGAILGEVELPYGFVPRDIGADYVLGTWRDELEVTHVRIYRLRR
jgi:hypothetical protein